jgi:hypothetical protein
MTRPSSLIQRAFSSKPVRTAHLLVVNASSGAVVTRALAYGGGGGGGRPQGRARPGSRQVIGGVGFRVYHGNHPNWIFDSHDISMNIAYKPKVSNSDLQLQLTFDIAKISFTGPEAKKCEQGVLIEPGVGGGYLGSGHPLFLRGGRYVLVDAYAKEYYLFPSEDRRCNSRGRVSVPLRLVDLSTKENKILFEVCVCLLLLILYHLIRYSACYISSVLSNDSALLCFALWYLFVNACLYLLMDVFTFKIY